MSEEDPTIPPARPPPQTLNYSTGRDEKKPYSVIAEMFFGFSLWVGAEILVGGLMLSTTNVSGSAYWMWILPSLGVLAIIWASILSYTRWKMRGFVPGILIGLGLTCLLPIGIVAVVCGNWHA